MAEMKNLFIATVLSIVILIGWQTFYESKNPVVEKSVTQETKTSKTEDLSENATVAPSNDTPKKKITSNLEQKTETIKINPKELLIHIENSHINGNLSRQGLIFSKISLKNYRESLDENASEVKLLDKKDNYYAEIGFAANEDNVIDLPNKNTIWNASGDKLTQDTPVTLTWKNSQGMEFAVKISLDDDYLFKIDRSVTNNKNEEFEINTFTKIYRLLDNKQYGGIGHEGVVGFFNKELIKTTYDKLLKQDSISMRSREKNDKLSWIGFGDKYWMSAIIGNEQNSSAIIKGDLKDGDKYIQIENKYSQTVSAEDDAFNRTEYLFFGAKELSTLDKYEKDLGITMFDHAVDFGSLYFITKPIFLFLQYLYKLVGNFGIAIMVLTLVIKFILFPLTKKSLISMNKMRKIQPKLDEIKAKYKDDKTRMNLEIVSVFKSNQISPFSSILPMIIQIPIFFALYKVLYITIEMRHAPFFGWIKDLSARDTLNVFSIFDFLHLNLGQYLNLGVLSIVLGATMILQQKLQPKPTEATQATMMKWMPWIFMIASSSFPAGLVIYWSWNNIISMVQQFIVDKFIIKKSSVEKVNVGNMDNIVEKVR